MKEKKNSITMLCVFVFSLFTIITFASYYIYNYFPENLDRDMAINIVNIYIQMEFVLLGFLITIFILFINNLPDFYKTSEEFIKIIKMYEDVGVIEKNKIKIPGELTLPSVSNVVLLLIIFDFIWFVSNIISGFYAYFHVENISLIKNIIVSGLFSLGIVGIILSIAYNSIQTHIQNLKNISLYKNEQFEEMIEELGKENIKLLFTLYKKSGSKNFKELFHLLKMIDNASQKELEQLCKKLENDNDEFAKTIVNEYMKNENESQSD